MACERAPEPALEPAPEAPRPPQESSRPGAEPDPHVHAPDAVPMPGAADEGASGCEALARLEQMDPREPVPLQPMMAWHQKQNMQQHLVAIERITGALSREDWEAVAEAAATIESSPQMQQMCQHMGAGAEGFTPLALKFHERADGIGEAAREQDTAGVLRATSETLQACTSCHATYRQQVVDAPTWEQLTGSSSPAHMNHGGHR